MAKIYYEKDTNPSLLEGKKIAIIGYGAQGHAHALNLKDSGVDVVVGLRPERASWEQAVKNDLQVATVSEAAAEADMVMMLVPDTTQPQVYEQEIRPHLKDGDILAFAHGFNIHFSQIIPASNIDVVMIAPKGPGSLVRRMYLEGKGVPSLIAVYQDVSGQARDFGLAYARALGAARAGVIETTFKEETETDLFGEQCVLCGGTSELIRAGFDTLVEAGYQPEVAYFECLHELKLIVDLIYEGGISNMREVISDTAEYGDLVIGKRIINGKTRAEMREVLKAIQSGSFARDWILENESGRPVYNAVRTRESEHPIEVVGRKLRAMMPWIRR